MNKDDAYLVNTCSAEYAQWRPAHWEREGDIRRFHVMRLDDTDQVVVLHESSIKRVRPETEALESEMKKLLTYKDLTPDAKKLMEKALEAQNTGRRPVLDFWI